MLLRGSNVYHLPESGRKPKLPAQGVGAFKAVGLTISNRRRSATVLLSKGNCSLKGRSGESCAQALHEIDRPNLTLRRTRFETTRSAPRLGAFWSLHGAALPRLERRHSAEAPTPYQWERLNRKDKKCHLVRMTEVAAAKQIAVANPTPDSFV